MGRNRNTPSVTLWCRYVYTFNTGRKGTIVYRTQSFVTRNTFYIVRILTFDGLIVERFMAIFESLLRQVTKHYILALNAKSQTISPWNPVHVQQSNCIHLTKFVIDWMNLWLSFPYRNSTRIACSFLYTYWWPIQGRI